MTARDDVASDDAGGHWWGRAGLREGETAAEGAVLSDATGS